MEACFSELQSPTPCKVFMVRIHRSGESVLTQGVLFPLRYEQTVHGTISRFHNLLANIWLSFDIGLSFGPWLSPCITQAVTNLKAGQSWGPEKVCLQPSICSGGSVGTPEGIPSMSGNHWIHYLAPFILDLGSWKHSKHFKQPLDSLSSAFYFESCILKGFRLCTFVLFRSSVWTLDFGLDLFSSGWIPEGKHNSH